MSYDPPLWGDLESYNAGYDDGRKIGETDINRQAISLLGQLLRSNHSATGNATPHLRCQCVIHEAAFKLVDDFHAKESR